MNQCIGYSVELTEKATKTSLPKKGYDSQYGARPQTVPQKVLSEDPVAEEI
jgi:hypothetical protein